MQAIEKLYAFLSVSPDGAEGILAFHTGETWMPMVGANMERMNSLRAFAYETSVLSGVTVVLAEFTNRVGREVIRSAAVSGGSHG